MMSKARFAAIILAAGEGTRFNSAVPKVLHEIAGRPMIRHVTEALRPLDPAETVVVLGPGMEAVARAVAPAKTAIQAPPRGTGDAVRAAKAALASRLKKGDVADVVVLFGDAPMLRSEAIATLLAERRRAPEAAIVVAGVAPGAPSPSGRPVVDPVGAAPRAAQGRGAAHAEHRAV